MIRLPKKVWEWLVCVGIVAGLAGVLLPVHACACGSPRTACLSNVKQMSIGMLMYRGDNNERMPFAETWMDALKDYVKSPQAFTDPEAGKNGKYGYSFNSRLTGKSSGVYSHPAAQPMLFDSTNLSRNASDPFISLPEPGRHKGANVVGYLDGHAKSVMDDPR